MEYIIRKKLIRQEQPCCLSDYLNKMKEISSKDFFILHGEAFMVFLKLFNSLVRKDVFIGDKPFSSPLVVYYLSKSINKRAKAELNRQAYIYLENGYKFKAFREVDNFLNRQLPRIKSTFRNAREYVKHYTLISDVKMNDFSFVYLLYIAWSLILLIFALRSHLGLLLRICSRHLNMLMRLTRRALKKRKITRLPRSSGPEHSEV